MEIDWNDAPNSRQLIVGGKRLEYACFGPPPKEAPTIIMLHEGLGCLALWRDFPAELSMATELGVFVYSRAGYGQSDPVDLPRPMDYMTREAVDVLPHVLDEAGVQNAVLLGHSDGATIAAIYAGSREDHRVRGLVLMAPHFFTEEAGLAEIAVARTAFEHDDLRTRMAKYHRDPENAFRAWNAAWLDPAFKAWNVADVIDNIRIPVLAIQGRDDQYGTLAQIIEIESRCYAPVELEVLEDCQHSPHLERRAATLSAISEFVARLMRIENEKVQVA